MCVRVHVRLREQEAGIDVTVLHPSPVDTGFYTGSENIEAATFFRRTATSPETIAGVAFASLGRSVVRDQGYFSFTLRFLLKVGAFAVVVVVAVLFIVAAAAAAAARVSQQWR